MNVVIPTQFSNFYKKMTDFLAAISSNNTILTKNKIKTLHAAILHQVLSQNFTINTQSSRVNGLPRFNCSTSIGPRLSRQQFFSISSTAYNYNKQYQTISCNDPSHLGWCVQHIYKFHGKSDH